MLTEPLLMELYCKRCVCELCGEEQAEMELIEEEEEV